MQKRYTRSHKNIFGRVRVNVLIRVLKLKYEKNENRAHPTGQLWRLSKELKPLNFSFFGLRVSRVGFFFLSFFKEIVYILLYFICLDSRRYPILNGQRAWVSKSGKACRAKKTRRVKKKKIVVVPLNFLSRKIKETAIVAVIVINWQLSQHLFPSRRQPVSISFLSLLSRSSLRVCVVSNWF